VVKLLDDHPNIRFFVDLHSYAEKILYNWGDDQNQTTNPNMTFRNPAFDGQRGIANDDAYREHIDSADQALAVELANRMREGIRAARGRAYAVDTFFSSYPTAGTCTDYAFSRRFADQSKAKVHSFTIEWGQEFQPPYTEMQDIIQEVTAGLLEFSLGIVDAVGYPTKPRVSMAPQVQYQGNKIYTVRAWDPYAASSTATAAIPTATAVAGGAVAGNGNATINGTWPAASEGGFANAGGAVAAAR